MVGTPGVKGQPRIFFRYIVLLVVVNYLTA